MAPQQSVLALLLLLAASIALSLAYPPVLDRAAVEAESLRLQGVAGERNLTRADIAPLLRMTEMDADLLRETQEVGWMIDHGFQNHVSHSLNAIYWIAKDGQWLCPADSLSHVGLFLQYNETAMAADAAKEGADALGPWAVKARAAKRASPDAYPDLEKLISVMEKVKPEFDSGDYAAAESDSDYLAMNGYC